jgi:glycosyltransferase involved in cell wall biosynthesis
MVTGFGKNARNILLALHEDPRIEVFEAANGIRFGTDLLTPWKSYGTLNQDPNLLQQIQGDHLKERYNAYGGYAIDQIIEDCKPDVYIGVEDIWAFPQYETKPWWNKINKILWTTLDSVPILDQALQMEPHCDKMLVWASFAEYEMKKLGHKNVETLHGAIDYTNFKPLDNRDDIRKRFNLSDNYVIGFVFKNQLRKSVPNLLDGFRKFKQKNPQSKPKLLLHTDWSEVGQGWDIPRYLKEKKVDKEDVLATYLCHKCDHYHVQPYQGEELKCPACGTEKQLKTKTSGKGVTEIQLNEIYNCMDVYCHPFTSGGQELPIQEAKAAGLVTLVTEYSCGTDSCYEDQGGMPLKWNEYREPQTQFVKASTCPCDIAVKLRKVYMMDEAEKFKLTTYGIRYVKNYFSTSVIANKLKNILFSLKKPLAIDEIKKEQQKTPSLDDVLADTKQEDRLAIVMPDSAGDVLMINSLIHNVKKLYPDKKIYVFTKPQYFHMIDDNPDLEKVLPYQPEIDNCYVLEGRGDNQGYFDIAFFPHATTQRTYSYTHNGKDKTQFKLR